MKNKIVTAVAVLTLGASLAVAAPHEGGKFGGRHGRHGMMGEKLAEKLNLTDAQKEQWKSIRKTSREQNAAFFQQAHQTMEQFRAAKKANDTAAMESLKPAMQSQRAQMKQIRDAERQQLLNILTAEQRAQFDALKAQRGERNHDRQ